MKLIFNLLLICVGMSVVASEESKIACSNSDKQIYRSYICDDIDDCPDAIDEDQELCQTWRDTRCPKHHVQCTRNGVTGCVSIFDYCSPETPRCEGNLDLRVCSMLEAGKIDKLSLFPLPRKIPDRCPLLYTLVGDQCLSFFGHGRMSWGEARAFCTFLDGDLLTIKNTSHFAQIIRHLQTHESPADFWIGGSIPNTTVGWTWLDGSPMQMGSPFWATRYSSTCIQRNVTTAKSETTCDHYYQAPEEVTKGECASLSFEHSFYMTDEDCLRKMSPLCVYQGRDFPKGPISQASSQGV